MIRSGIIAFALFAALVAASTTAPRAHLFSGLKPGQPVGLKDHGGVYEISVFQKRIPQPYKIVETGEDFIVVQDITQTRTLRIPATSIKAIVQLRTR